jgi:2'-5' RNA ligase
MRLFFAFELSDEARAVATRTQALLRDQIGSRDVRWTDPSDMHITTLFLGDNPNERLSIFTDAAVDAVSTVKPFTVNVQGVGRFPDAGPPRVVWLGAQQPDGQPASQIISALRKLLPDISVDHASYRPHITLAYVRPTTSRVSVDQAVDAVKQEEPIPMIVDRLVLMQTIPQQERRKSNSARYNIVQVFPFPV